MVQILVQFFLENNDCVYKIKIFSNLEIIDKLIIKGLDEEFRL